MVTMRYLLDTNVLSEQIKPQPNPHLMSKLEQHRHEIATATVVWHELWFGCYRLPVSRKRERIEHFLQKVIRPYIPILPYTQAAAEWHAGERARLNKIGKPPSFADGQIAAIVKVNDLILVTANVSDYQMFDGLAIENWFLPD
jgi:tRNA(fMet)-specific endonuclease VapC